MQTKPKSVFTMFGTPERVIVDGKTQPKDSSLQTLAELEHNKSVRALVVARVSGVVKVYVSTKEA